MTHDSEHLDPAGALRALRELRPLTHCITNAVVTNFTANALLSLGATPAMVDVPTEAGPFASVANGLLVNLGTPQEPQRIAAREAVAATGAWVLDPVAVGSLPVRTALAAELIDAKPAIIRGNASEILALAGLGQGGRGVDSTDDPESAVEAANALVARSGAVVAVSGEVDVIVAQGSITRVRGGSELLTRITGGGCALGAIMAAFLSVTTPRGAAVAASVLFAAASERAQAVSQAPGSFAVAFIDQLALTGPGDLDANRRTTVSEHATA